MVHRSALYELVISDNDDNTKTFKEIVEEPAFLPLIYRRNTSGSTLLHEACRKNFPEKAAILVRKGVEVEGKVEGQERTAEGDLVEMYLEKNENSDGEMPITSLVNHLEGDQVTSFLKKLKTKMDIAVFVGSRENALCDLCLLYTSPSPRDS